ncbi:unnamed protein product [Leptosia nina]|uniref:Uncharacterized protein n=1 Tax=Leptosia nina TaxID=320188 RepID=A0AAV1JCT1_9NEOP
MTTRKRKYQEMNVKKGLKDFQREIMSFLEANTKTQMANIMKLRKEFAEIKSEIHAIKSTSESVNTNRSNIDLELAGIKTENRSLREKLMDLESTLTRIKETQGSSKSVSCDYERVETQDCFQATVLPVDTKDHNLGYDDGVSLRSVNIESTPKQLGKLYIFI